MIRVPEVRLVGENVEVGVYPTQEALRIAQAQSLDLVEISPTANPPVCVLSTITSSCMTKRKEKGTEKSKTERRKRDPKFTPITRMTTI
ncbi:MAG: hypothetical protein U0T56_01420 [Ferruginibacter sp.]